MNLDCQTRGRGVYRCSSLGALERGMICVRGAARVRTGGRRRSRRRVCVSGARADGDQTAAPQLPARRDLPRCFRHHSASRCGTHAPCIHAAHCCMRRWRLPAGRRSSKSTPLEPVWNEPAVAQRTQRCESIEVAWQPPLRSSTWRLGPRAAAQGQPGLAAARCGAPKAALAPERHRRRARPHAPATANPGERRLQAIIVELSTPPNTREARPARQNDLAPQPRDRARPAPPSHHGHRVRHLGCCLCAILFRKPRRVGWGRRCPLPQPTRPASLAPAGIMRPPSARSGTVAGEQRVCGAAAG